MKIRFFILTLVLFTVFALPVGASLPLVVDNANILTTEEERELETLLQEKSNLIDGDLVVLTVPSLEGATAQAYADDYFDYTGYGRGETWNGALFLVAMEERQWAISTCGTVFDAMTEYALDTLEDAVIPYLSAEEYATAFREYATITAGYVLDMAQYEQYDDYYNTHYNNTHYTNSVRNSFGSEWIVISLVVGFLFALIPMGVLKKQLNTVAMQTGAADYQKNGVHITDSRDLFLYRNLSKRAKPKDPPRTSGGGGGHISSSGRSHGGRSGGF